MPKTNVRKYLAFDIETATDIPGEEFDWRSHRPLGICCAAAIGSDAKTPILWHAKNAEGAPAEKLSRDDAKGVVESLTNLVSEGYTLLTWNGLGFDLDVLAEESGMLRECKALAINHVDMMFHVFCEKGFPVAIDKAAEALGVPGKLAGMSGKLAPKLRAKGRHKDVLDYVMQDVRMTVDVAVQCEASGRFQWMTRRGKKDSFSLKQGWLTVGDAMTLPTPDTSWMSEPIARSSFTRWLDMP